ncbi:DUF4058 family protein [Paludisphaera borealis]|uniref:DUF4058 family protein n=1 Tax=Paludisphaera borealis TaxID=1387353 RepID=A0A1U7CTP6_9BACT|nr:DUF4058 family protein [Paludisphaera borealis]APW62301.1 hypothetical protein BSF38_03840 [Paludisphaera borealis]
MPSPFPGMNPWIEQEGIWVDFHAAFIPAIRRQLAQQVLPKYIVLMEEQVSIHEVPASRVRSMRPDLAITRPERGREPRAAVGVAEIEAPYHPSLPEEEVERQPYLEIRDRENRELVTVIELLSPSNKRPGEDRWKDLEKRRAVRRGTAHLVEIDLLRGYPPMPLEDRPECDYSVLVSRAERRPVVDFWPIDVRDRLPVVPIPLRSPDGDAQVDLQAALDQVYDDAGYVHFIYQGNPNPALAPEDAEWAESFLPEVS